MVGLPSDAGATIAHVNKRQLAFTKHGVRLLTGHLRQPGESLDKFCADEDAEAAIACADPLVHVAAILLRQLRDATDGTIESALQKAAIHADPVIAEYWPYMEQFLPALISGRVPPQLPINSILVALTAQEVATGAATELSAIENIHRNAVVARLRKQLREQGDGVQLFDRDGVERAANEYAADPQLRRRRLKTADTCAGMLTEAAHRLREQSINDAVPEPARIAFDGIARVAIIAGKLAGGVVQLVYHDNLYPAWTLLRQLVETEFVLWRFAKDPESIAIWVESSKEDRERDWKPSRIYRDVENDYRQKDYSGHCELGGHPTPAGANLAGGVGLDRARASVLFDLIGHARESWSHLRSSVKQIDEAHHVASSTMLEPLCTQFDKACAQWSSVERYQHTTSYFSDPID